MALSEVALYPAAFDVIPEQEAKKDKASKAFVNRLANCIEAIEAELGLDVAGDQADLVTRLGKILSDTGALRNGSSFPVTTETALLFFRTDENTIYVRNAADSAWVVLGTAGTSGFQMGAYSSGHGGTITWGTEIFDIGADTTTTTFTAPADGYYLLTFSFTMETSTGGAGEEWSTTASIVTSNRTYSQTARVQQSGSSDPGYRSVCVCVVADMDSGDTAHCTTSNTENTNRLYSNEHFSGIRIG